MLCFVALAAAADSPAARRIGTLALEPCTLAAPNSPTTVSGFCGRLAVAEDREASAGRRIELAVALVPSRAKRPLPDPVFMLAGGPGQSALETYPAAAAAFRDVLRDRDVVLVDQRGTGGSNRLACPEPDAGAGADAFGDPSAARKFAEACLAGLEADPRFYTTSDAVLDLEDVRAALGAEQVNLVGVSYGTRVALEYLRRHPDRTRTVVLDGVVPPELALGADHARNLENALDAHFAICEADATCRERYGSPRARLAAVSGGLQLFGLDP